MWYLEITLDVYVYINRCIYICAPIHIDIHIHIHAQKHYVVGGAVSGGTWPELDILKLQSGSFLKLAYAKWRVNSFIFIDDLEVTFFPQNSKASISHLNLTPSTLFKLPQAYAKDLLRSFRFFARYPNIAEKYLGKEDPKMEAVRETRMRRDGCGSRLLPPNALVHVTSLPRYGKSIAHTFVIYLYVCSGSEQTISFLFHCGFYLECHSGNRLKLSW